MLEDQFVEVLAEANLLFQQKNESYGPNNIAIAGYQGVLIRTSDKFQRLLNLQTNQISEELNSESIEDSLLDILNYAAIMILLRRNIWPEVNHKNHINLIEQQIKELKQCLATQTFVNSSETS